LISAGHCVVDDDMSDILSRFLSSDLAVFASPIYFFSFSGIMKCFIDRLFPLLMPLTGSVYEHAASIGHQPRYPEEGPHKCALVLTAGALGTEGADGISMSFERTARVLGMVRIGTIVRPESFFMDFGVGRERTLRRVREAIRKSGEELAREGRISEETSAAASLSLVRDRETYCRRTTDYFRITLGEDVIMMDRGEIRQRVMEDLSVVMPSVAACYDPHVGGHLTAVLNFDISDTVCGVWCFDISNGICEAKPVHHASPDVSIATDITTWLSLLKGQVDGRRAVAEKRLRINGDARLFFRFGRLFPNPAT
jgi:putative NADPH-quinone reductase